MAMATTTTGRMETGDELDARIDAWHAGTGEWPTYRGVDGEQHPMNTFECSYCGRPFPGLVPSRKPNCAHCDRGEQVAAYNRDLYERMRNAYKDQDGNCTCRESDCGECGNRDAD